MSDSVSNSVATQLATPTRAATGTALDDGRIQCDLCPRDCSLKAGDRGFCFVRENVGGEMVLTTYGRSTGFCIDPIEKKPLNHFYPGTSVLSFGTAGCNLGCKFCQNWDISKSREVERLSEIATPEAIAAAAQSHRLQERRVHLQRPGHLGRVRHRHGASLPRASASRRSPSPPATSRPRRGGRSSR